MYAVPDPLLVLQCHHTSICLSSVRQVCPPLLLPLFCSRIRSIIGTTPSRLAPPHPHLAPPKRAPHQGHGHSRQGVVPHASDVDTPGAGAAGCAPLSRPSRQHRPPLPLGRRHLGARLARRATGHYSQRRVYRFNVATSAFRVVRPTGSRAAQGGHSRAADQVLAGILQFFLLYLFVIPALFYRYLCVFV
jgi:hypothetical protein